jgi:hypothetical protein
MSLLLLLRGRQAGAGGVTGTATWEQTATWEATAKEAIRGTATWSQDASWAATAKETARSTATWTQSASWAATGQSLVNVTATAAWEQSAIWDADGQVLQNVTGTAAWEQAQSWAAVGNGGATQVSGFESRRPQKIRLDQTPHLFATASFEQQPASWSARMTVDRSPVDIEDLILVGVL